MVKIGSFLKATRENAQSAAPWAEDFVQPLNSQVSDLTSALQGKLGDGNLNEEDFDIEVKHNIEGRIELKTLKGAPKEIRLLWWDLKEKADLVYWHLIDEKHFSYLIKATSAPTEAFRVRLAAKGR